LKLSAKDVVKLLEQARYKADVKGKKIELFYPAYRQDIMHQRDVTEDVIISYGYNKISPETIRQKTMGKINDLEVFCEDVTKKMVELGFQEILSYVLTNKNFLFNRMNLKEEEIVEIENPISVNWNVFRSWLLPSLMEFFSNNQHVNYPQKIFEIGDVILIDMEEETRTKDVKKITAAIADSRISYGDMVSILDALLNSLHVNYKLRKTVYGSFIDGRVAEVVVNDNKIGFIGEIHPIVLKNWKLEMPVAAFELTIEELL